MTDEDRAAMAIGYYDQSLIKSKDTEIVADQTEPTEIAIAS